MSETSIRVEPIAGALGAEISGVDLRERLDELTAKAIHEAWMQHQVLFLRDQHLTRAQHRDFASHFGDLHVHPVLQPLKEEGYPEIVVLESDEKRRYLAAGWHSDVTFQREPPMGSILRCIEAPSVGGDTMWSSMYAAYDALSDTMQRLLSELRAVHRGEFFNLIAKNQDEKDALAANNESAHPVIRTHPVTGRKGLFVNFGFTRSIEGMKPDESELLLRFLFEHVGNAEFTCRFRWRPGSIAMWDNRCTQHRVVADNVGATRHMERITISGDAPH